MAEEQQATLRDQLADAFEAEAPIETPAASAVADTHTDRPRTEDGKFAKVERQETKPADAAAEPDKVERPSTWKKDYWEKYDKLDPDVRKYILQRENEYKAGLSTYNGEVKSAQTLKQAIEPFLPELQRNNIDPSQWIRNLGTAHQQLALGSPQQKQQMFLKLANDYGVDLRQLGAPVGAPDPQIQYLYQNLQGVQQQLQQFQTNQQMAEQQSIAATIEEFKADTDQHPHFDAVRETMAGLLSSGLAQNLQDAYDKAVYMAPDVREQVLSAQQQRDQASRLEQQAAVAKKARANAVSPRSSNPGAPVVQTGKKGLRDQLAESFGELSSRV